MLVSVVQLVSRQEIGLKKSCTELRSVVGLHQIWQCYYILGTTTKLSMPFQVLLKEISILVRLRSN